MAYRRIKSALQLVLRLHVLLKQPGATTLIMGSLPLRPRLSALFCSLLDSLAALLNRLLNCRKLLFQNVLTRTERVRVYFCHT